MTKSHLSISTSLRLILLNGLMIALGGFVLSEGGQVHLIIGASLAGAASLVIVGLLFNIVAQTRDN